MPNILFLSENKGFVEDIKEQIGLYAKEYNVYNEYDPELVYELVMIDDMPHIINHIKESGVMVPIIYFQSNENKKVPFTPTDIVVKKPFVLDNFLDFLKSSIQMFDNSSDGSIGFNEYELLPSKKEIVNKKTNEVVKLTEKEVAVIKYLYKARGRIVSKNELLQEVWGYSPDSTTHTIETHIYRLRSKVENSENCSPIIVTEDGGYKIVY
ncbi:MAG: winged helix-turn-helix domain-containing protein [Lactobacillaceae bacterium]|jgi:DNA-binding response OmpR family regulator|nr:winged helix-turn-helix domain-containing protein [Lactobacillaceae bacterium]